MALFFVTYLIYIVIIPAQWCRAGTIPWCTAISYKHSTAPPLPLSPAWVLSWSGVWTRGKGRSWWSHVIHSMLRVLLVCTELVHTDQTHTGNQAQDPSAAYQLKGNNQPEIRAIVSINCHGIRPTLSTI